MGRESGESVSVERERGVCVCVRGEREGGNGGGKSVSVCVRKYLSASRKHGIAHTYVDLSVAGCPRAWNEG